jgi:hypothetical protein
VPLIFGQSGLLRVVMPANDEEVVNHRRSGVLPVVWQCQPGQQTVITADDVPSEAKGIKGKGKHETRREEKRREERQ